MTKRRGRTLALLVLSTGVGTAVYWLLAAQGLFGEPNLLAWMRKFPYTSPIADAFLVAACVAYCVSWRRGEPASVVWGAAAGASMVYASLIAFGFLLAQRPAELTAGHVVELAVPGYLLVAGATYLRALHRSLQRPSGQGAKP